MVFMPSSSQQRQQRQQQPQRHQQQNRQLSGPGQEPQQHYHWEKEHYRRPQETHHHHDHPPSSRNNSNNSKPQKNSKLSKCYDENHNEKQQNKRTETNSNDIISNNSNTNNNNNKMKKKKDGVPSSSSSMPTYSSRRTGLQHFLIGLGVFWFTWKNVQLSLQLLWGGGSSTTSTTTTTTTDAQGVFLDALLLPFDASSSSSSSNHDPTKVGQEQDQQPIMPYYDYFNRPAILDILKHPQKTGPSRQQEKNHHPAKQNITWTQFRTAPGIQDCTRNLLRVQDFLQQPATPQLGATTTFPVTDEDELYDSSQPQPPRNVLLENQNNNNNNNNNNNKNSKKPLNILLLYADDWTLNVLGALNEHVQTPNLDAMAHQRGMLFTRNCVTSSICWISRNTLTTGVYSAVHQHTRIHDWTMFQHDRFVWNDTLYAQLKQHHHYFTGLVGKWHAPSPPEYMKEAFHVFKNYYGKHWMMRNGQLRHVTDLNGEDALAFLHLWHSKHRYPTEDNHHPNDNNDPATKTTANSPSSVTEPDERPFFLQVSFYATHARDYSDPPYQPMHESLSLYQNVTIPRPRTATEQHYQDLPWFMKNPRNQARQRNVGRFDTAQNYQEQIKNLYRMATEVDAVIGAILDELKALQAYDNTLIIFTTDNGNLHGEHGLAEKWYPYQESIRVPLIIQDPRMPASQRGRTNHEDFTLNVDLAPTILSAAQIPIPPHMQGRDMAQLYLHADDGGDDDGPKKNDGNNHSRHEAIKASWRQDFFYEWNTGEPINATGHKEDKQKIPAVFALIRKDYKYFYWPEENYEQLFYMEQDPYEERDVFRDTSTTTQQALMVMRARYRFLKTWAQAGNPV
ncbi:hypothetical protein ACA910_019184 [Epithemia clementina (nom. ined.)]